MDPFGSTSSAVGPFGFAEAGRAFFQCAPDIEKLLSADQQPLLDLKYLRLAHSIIQDALEAEQNGEPSSLPTAERELALYLDGIRDCTTMTGHLRHQNSSDLPTYAQTQDELAHRLREARICSEQLHYRLEEGARLSRYLHVDRETFAKWLCYPLRQTEGTRQRRDHKYGFLNTLKGSDSPQIEEQDMVWFEREDQCYDHMESILPIFQEILKTGCKIFMLSWRPVPHWLKATGLVQVTYSEPSYSSAVAMRPVHWTSEIMAFRRQTPASYDCPRPLDGMLNTLASDTGPNFMVSLNVLIWVVFAFQRLTTEQLQAAIGDDFSIFLEASNADPDNDSDHAPRLQSLFSIGNDIRSRSEEARFQSELLGIEEIPQGGPHALLTKQCLSYIRNTCDTGRLPNTADDLEEWLRRFPLLHYAGKHWGRHAEKVETLPSQLLDSITDFLGSRHLEELAAMLLSNADQDAKNYKGAYKSMTGLHLACAFGLVKVVPHMLHSRKFSPYLRTEGGWTALHWATLRRKEEIVSFLLSLPDSNSLLGLTTSVERWTALHLAAKEDCPSLVINLATDRTIIDAEDLWGRTALYLACWRGHISIVEHLLSKGANPNIDNVYGTTLHCAVKQRNPDLVRTLIGATRCPLDLNIRNPIQLTALEEAQNRGLDDIAAILLDAGAKSGLSLDCASQQQALQPFALDSASTFHWRCYEVDSDLSCHVRRGKQCKGDVLRLIPQKSTDAPHEAKMKLQTRDSDGESVMPKYVFRKTFDIVNDRHGKIQKYLLSEWQILSKLEHPHIAGYIDSDEDPYRSEFLLYTEYCDQGDLALRHGLPLEDLPTGDNKKYGFTDEAMIQSSEVRPLTGVEVWAMIWQLASALAYLHYGISVKRKDSICTAFLEGVWSYVIHRDVKPANETIRSTFKVRDEMLDCKAFRDFLDSARQADCSSRIDSLTAMEVACENLRPVPFGTAKLPQLVIEEMCATHQLLGRGEGGYLIQAFAITAQLLDIPNPFGDDSTKEKRTSIVNRLWLLLDDGAEEYFYDKEGMSKAHLLVLLDGRKKVEKAARLRQFDEVLHSGSNINLQWPRSGWTALHLAAQEGKLGAVQKLLQHGAKTNMKDKHGKTAMDYAGDNGFAEVAALLAPSGLAETVNAFHVTSVTERSVVASTQEVESSRGSRLRIRERWKRLAKGLGKR
ncbi:NACHT and Ankyrin domain [Fusarium albosuccineum]|uniref:NACHT and Ankyrin domain n=1 Tax=Fusarium albosuccineum TaxID=1237068 RepID=A0A8H4L479_9HYPO|nr:NACHT and Ankyrin domain [Fusarium albosuccineum]